MQRYYSNIYWHFTGSPDNLDWHNVKSPEDILTLGGRTKSEAVSFNILDKILQSNKLLATCDEKIIT